ncbi:hypothetical protein B0H17DRAFT_1135188 [Mycena rosella]|uniref:Uncharacterized protein n=1 Tax=Mycena rosella TaxID=1033263 RepID=A0AAD7DEB4_MYCRO|nr:hypothetical protein B0H17DRAFT_1135188 [Mycena rosella]
MVPGTTYRCTTCSQNPGRLAFRSRAITSLIIVTSDVAFSINEGICEETPIVDCLMVRTLRVALKYLARDPAFQTYFEPDPYGEEGELTQVKPIWLVVDDQGPITDIEQAADLYDEEAHPDMPILYAFETKELAEAHAHNLKDLRESVEQMGQELAKTLFAITHSPVLDRV